MFSSKKVGHRHGILMPDKLLFDLAACQEQGGGPHGGSEYAISIFEFVLRRASIGTIEFFLDARRSIAPQIIDGIKARGFEIHEISGPRDLQRVLNCFQGGRFFSALADGYESLDFGDMHVVITIHGMRPVELPSDPKMLRYSKSSSRFIKDVARITFEKTYRNLRKRSFHRLTRLKCRQQTIIVPSYHTKYALLTAFDDLESSQIRVLASPPTIVCNTEPGVLGFDLEPRSYFLLVSGQRWVKNAFRAMQAFELLLSRLPSSQHKRLIIVGGAPARMNRHWKDVFAFLPYVDLPSLAALYANAFALLYPTLNEGFGYPPLEAMRFGTPVISSNVCSLPEVLGDAPLYFDPRNVEEITNRCYQLIDRRDLWGQLADRGRWHYAQMGDRQRVDLAALGDLLLDGLGHE